MNNKNKNNNNGDNDRSQNKYSRLIQNNMVVLRKGLGLCGCPDGPEM